MLYFSSICIFDQGLKSQYWTHTNCWLYQYGFGMYPRTNTSYVAYCSDMNQTKRGREEEARHAGEAVEW